MKRSGFYLVVLLAVTLAFGLAFSGCDSEPPGDTYGPRTMVTLFEKVKDFTLGNIRAYRGSDETIGYCSTHEAWETWEYGVGPIHLEAPIFELEDAEYLQLWVFYRGENVPPADLGDLIAVLDSFFSDEFKTAAAPGNATTIADGTELYAWYSATISSDGYGSYGASATATETPCPYYTYSFPVD